MSSQLFRHCRWAFAELNALLQQHQHMMEEVTLRSYHSFTREAKAVVLQRVIAADPAVTSRRAAGHSGSCAPFACPAAMQPLQPAQLPLHLQMAMHILDRSFRAFSDCSVVRYTFADRPAWLAQVRGDAQHCAIHFSLLHSARIEIPSDLVVQKRFVVRAVMIAVRSWSAAHFDL